MKIQVFKCKKEKSQSARVMDDLRPIVGAVVAAHTVGVRADSTVLELAAGRAAGIALKQQSWC